ncbi:hypothetical protein Tco_0705272 [Tanacetum coccineum]|uniref:Reverse transcriptase zinc-binding domain-containing protein n=1 Tax=Tanacetum coccineum TaxID=301880 RepID=A0ABQ4Y497_9ASTR
MIARGWRKILQLRPLIRSFIWSCIGDGSQTSMWFDRWCVASPLSSIISSRVIFRAGWNLSTKVRDLIHEGNWHWSNDWTTKYPLLCDIPILMISNEKCDYLEWRDNDGVGKPFSVYHVWNSIRPRNNVVPWADFVWFRNCIPRHAFNMWLILCGFAIAFPVNDFSNNIDTKKLKENIHAIQASCKICLNILFLLFEIHMFNLFILVLIRCVLVVVWGCVNLDGEWVIERMVVIVSAWYLEAGEGHMRMVAGVVGWSYVVYYIHVALTLNDKGRLEVAQEDNRDIDDGWEITIKDVESLRHILTPTIHTLPNLEPVVQPYMLRGPARDEVKVVREEELEYDISLQNRMMQPLTPLPLGEKKEILATINP